MNSPVYIVYGRYSGEGQRGNSSVERQMDIEHYRGQAENYGLPFVEKPYFDDAKSGYHGDNLEAELGKIFADIKSGALPPGSIIGTESHSRLGRLSANEALYQYLDILRIGIKLDIKGRALRTWDSIGGLTGVLVLMEDFIDMVVAHKHSADLSKTERDTNRIKRDQIRAGQRDHTMKKGGPGWFVGNRCPAWLAPLDEPLIIEGRSYLYAIDPEMARIIRMIFAWADQGLGGRKIAERLNGMKPPISPLTNKKRTNPDKKLAGWSGTMVLTLLKNRALIGEWQPRVIVHEDENGKRLPYRQKAIEGAVMEHYYPPVIQGEQFQRVQDRLAANDAAPVANNGRKGIARGGRKGRGFGNIVIGLCYCACCGGTLTLWSRPKDGKVYKYLKCSNYQQKVVFPEGHPLAGQRCTNKRGFSYRPFEAMLSHLFMVKPLIAALTTRAEQDNEPSRVKLADLNRQIERKRQVHHDYHIELDELTGDERRETRERMRALLVEIGDLEVERDGLASLIRQAERMQSEDFDDRVRAGWSLIDSPHEIEREDARSALNAMLKERMAVVLNAHRVMTIMFRNDRTIGTLALIQDYEVVGAGLYSEDGRNLLDLTDLRGKLDEIGIRIAGMQAKRLRINRLLDAASDDPNVRDALAVVRERVA